MNDEAAVTGIVLSVQPIGEYDKRLVLLTKELGKISAFAKGARRPNSPLVAAGRLFACGDFVLYEGRSSYTVKSARIGEFFDYLSDDVEAMCYASYFGELADHFCRENVPAGREIKLLYFAIRALRLPQLSRHLVKRVYELKLLALEGEYFPEPRTQAGDSARYAWDYVLKAPLEKLYTFTLEEESFREFSLAVGDMMAYFVDREFRSLKVLEDMNALMGGKV